MKTISFRIEDELKDRLDDLAERRGHNLSHLFRQALAATLEEMETGVSPHLGLTLKDRLYLANQYQILEALYPREAETLAQHREALERGYQLHYPWLVEHFSDGMSRDACKEVLDILDMHRFLKFSYVKLEDKSGIDETEIIFRGFDGNHETAQMAYARYFVFDLDRYLELARDAQEDFNSHMPILDVYRRMVAEWKNSSDPHHLSKDDIRRIIDANPWRRPAGSAA